MLPTFKIYYKKVQIKKLKKSISKAIDIMISKSVNVEKSILVNGFWRSGTTWILNTIAQAYGAKTIFEPLHPKIDRYVRVIRNSKIRVNENKEYLNAFMPYIDNRCMYPGLNEYFRDALTRRLTDDWLRQAGRDGERSCLLRKTVSKTVRGHLALAQIKNNFNPTKVAHVWRDPRSVVASLKRNNWAYWMRKISPVNHLLFPKDGREEYFYQLENQIKKYENRSFTCRATAYWAATECFVRDTDSCDILIGYDKACKKGVGYILSKIGISKGKKVSAYYKDSHTVDPQRRNVQSEERLYGWKDELSKTDVREVVEVVNDFGLTGRI